MCLHTRLFDDHDFLTIDERTAATRLTLRPEDDDGILIRRLHARLQDGYERAWVNRDVNCCARRLRRLRESMVRVNC
jgi:hypothetical protein